MQTPNQQFIPEHPTHPRHLDLELRRIRKNTLEMWKLVIQQLRKSQEALFQGDKALAREVKANEKRVDAMELSITNDCENLLALFNPVAVDLRFVLSVLKISYELERIGDYAKSIASIAEDIHAPLSQELLEKIPLPQLFSDASSMLNDVYSSFENDDNKLAIGVFGKDENLDRVNKQSISLFTNLIQENPDKISLLLNLLSVIRRLERLGDQTKNIAEEIIFYLEARIIKHSKKKKTEPPVE